MIEVQDRADLAFDRHDEEVAALFRTPAGVEEIWLAEALLGIFDAVGWLQEALGGAGRRMMLVASLDRRRAALPPEQRGVRRRELAGDYDAAGIMIGRAHGHQPRGLQVFRALVWLVLTKRHRANRSSKSAMQDLASAMRAAATLRAKATGPLNQALGELGQAGSFGEAIKALSRLDDPSHRSLQAFWIRWLLPELIALAKEHPGVPSPPSFRSDGHRTRFGPGSPKLRREKDVEQERIETTDGPRVEGLTRSRRFDDQLPHEPPAEFGEKTYLVTVPGRGAGLAESVAQFYAMRAIWTGNTHLLTSHVDAVLPPVYGAVVRRLIEKLVIAPPGSEAALGATGCLLKAITGRPTAGLKALRIGGAGHEGDIRDGCIDADAGLIWVHPRFHGHLQEGR